jgi:HCOMODA/2-hydroxy-3-carboxy-muconic semialdehyde decarboxylase
MSALDRAGLTWLLFYSLPPPQAADVQRDANEDMPVADALADLRYTVALANRMLAHEGVLDAFGHVSARHPTNPERYILSRSLAPEMVNADDVLEYYLDSEPVEKTDIRLYVERVIHGEIYKARPDVMCVVHHHAPAFMPFVVAGIDYVPVFHLGMYAGVHPPFWDQREEFGDTNLLVVKPEEGASLARRLGGHSMVLMRRHGVTVAGSTVPEAVFRSVYSCRNAEFQLRAAMVGSVTSFTPGEMKLGTASNPGLQRAWDLWRAHLEKAGALPARSAA